MYKILLLVNIICFSFVNLVAQPTFNKYYGGDSLERGIYIIQNQDSSYISIGYTLTTTSGQDVLVHKIDKQGREIWSKHFDINGNDFAWSIVRTDIANQFLMLGFSENATTKDEDIFICQIDIEGNLLWKHVIPIANDQRAWSLEKLADGNYLIIGQTVKKGSQDFDGLVIKVSPRGQIIWQTSLAQEYYDRTFYAKELADGNIAISGLSRREGIPTSLPWYALLDKNGNKILSRIFETKFDKTVHGIIRLPSNQLMIYGYAKNDSSGYNRPYMFTVTAAGDKVEEFLDLSDSYDVHLLTGVKVDDGYTFTGYTRKLLTDPWDGMLVHYDKTGKLKWKKLFAGNAIDQFYTLISTYDKGYALVGHSFSEGKGGQLWVVVTDEFGNVRFPLKDLE